MSTTSYCRCSSAASASGPLAATSATKPSFRSSSTASCWLTALSSASRIRSGEVFASAGSGGRPGLAAAPRFAGRARSRSRRGAETPSRASSAEPRTPPRSPPRRVAERGEQDQRQVGMRAPDLAREREAVHVRHLHVDHGDVEAIALADPGERIRAAPRKRRRASPMPWPGGSRSRGWSRCRPPRGGAGPRAAPLRRSRPGATGARPRRASSVTWNVDPLPTSLSAHSSPPISSTRRFEIARPSPVPP